MSGGGHNAIGIRIGDEYWYHSAGGSELGRAYKTEMRWNGEEMTPVGDYLAGYDEDVIMAYYLDQDRGVYRITVKLPGEIEQILMDVLRDYHGQIFDGGPGCMCTGESLGILKRALEIALEQGMITKREFVHAVNKLTGYWNWPNSSPTTEHGGRWFGVYRIERAYINNDGNVAWKAIYTFSDDEGGSSNYTIESEVFYDSQSFKDEYPEYWEYLFGRGTGNE